MVISLPGSSRLPIFLDQEAARGFTVFDAIDGRTAPSLEGFDDAGFEARYGRIAKGGERGCSMSHLGAIAQFAAADDGADMLLLAEDDCEFGPDFEERFARIVPHLATADLTVLTNYFSTVQSGRFDRGAAKTTMSLLGRNVRVRGADGYWLQWVGRTSFSWYPGAALYVVSRPAARRLTEMAAGGVDWLADDFMFYESQGFRTFQTRPVLAQQRTGMDSQIQDAPPQVELQADAPGLRARLRAGSRMTRAVPAMRLGAVDVQERLRTAGKGT